MKALKNKVLAGLAILLSPLAAMANNAAAASGDEFGSFYTTVHEWSSGGLGTGLAISSLLVGSGIAVTKNSPMPALAGVGVAAFLKWGPDIITSLVTGSLI